ncbi:hypothetical protein B0H13DRAFT_2373328 [Mycena leptocephala]|nr:hypothetical protein B0H13DRAFT_2373328 [Mycena leptocephala]
MDAKIKAWLEQDFYTSLDRIESHARLLHHAKFHAEHRGMAWGMALHAFRERLIRKEELRYRAELRQAERDRRELYHLVKCLLDYPPMSAVLRAEFQKGKHMSEMESESAPLESPLSPEERRELDLIERELKQEVIKAGDVGPLSKAAREWLARNRDTPTDTVSRAEPEGKKWGTPDLVTREEIKARVAYLVHLREAALEAAAARKAAGKAKRGAKTVG